MNIANLEKLLHVAADRRLFAPLSLSSWPLASVVIPNLHSPHLGAVIDALRQQTVMPCEVIVVGQDRYHLAQDDGWVRLVPTPRPLPPSVVTNIAIAYARGEVICFLDADCVPAPDWLARLLLHQAQGRLAVGGSIGFQPQNYWQRCDNIACMGPFLSTAPAGERPYLVSANMALHRDLLRQIGPFDESFRRASGEDTDITFRVRSAGMLLYFDPKAVVFHYTNRDSARTAWRHMHTYALEWPKLVRKHQALLPRSIWLWLLRVAPALALATIPVATLRDVYRLYAIQPALLRHSWVTIPGVFWARLGWYAGLIEATRSEEL